jgi:hypothetical protein
MLLVGTPFTVHAAEPSPTPSVIGTGDPRSEGEGPGLQGSPLLILLGVVGIGITTAAATVLYLRLRRPDQGP